MTIFGCITTWLAWKLQEKSEIAGQFYTITCKVSPNINPLVKLTNLKISMTLTPCFKGFFLHPGPSSTEQDQDTPCQLHRWERDFRLVSLSLRHHVALEWAAPNGWAPPCRMEGSNMGQQSKNPQFLDAHFKWKLNILMGSLFVFSYLVLVSDVNRCNEQPTLIMQKKTASTDSLTDQLTS